MLAPAEFPFLRRGLLTRRFLPKTAGGESRAGRARARALHPPPPQVPAMDWLLVLIAAIIFLMVLVMNLYVLYYYMDPQDKNVAWLPKIVVVRPLLSCRMHGRPWPLAAHTSRARRARALRETPGRAADRRSVARVLRRADAAAGCCQPQLRAGQGPCGSVAARV